MDFQHPFRVVGASVDGEVLALLARAHKAYTGREVARQTGSSQDAVRLSLQRLGRQGILDATPGGGRSILYELNRDHLAAPLVEHIATLHLTLLKRLRAEIEAWDPQPVAAVLFGSSARGEASSTSDIDLLVVRPKDLDAEDIAWHGQIMAIEDKSTRWTGNDTRVFEVAEEEFPSRRGVEPAIDAALEEGIEIGGEPLRMLRKRMKGARKR
ncbi:MAG: nucleotidyltransferase domain-containing protein [Actinobacteria bacterium]|nr:nucleotidyltransferase domain-containing protein [Actinomycetota bacterium]